MKRQLKLLEMRATLSELRYIYTEWRPIIGSIRRIGLFFMIRMAM